MPPPFAADLSPDPPRRHSPIGRRLRAKLAINAPSSPAASPALPAPPPPLPASTPPPAPSEEWPSPLRGCLLSLRLGSPTPPEAEALPELRQRGARLCAARVALPRQDTLWTCGYENIAAILHTVLSMGVFEKVPPAVRSIAARHAPLPAESIVAMQECIDAAWRAGYDSYSSATLSSMRGRRGRDGHIGAPEAFCLFARWGLDVWLAEVHGSSKTPADGSSPLRGSGEALYAMVKAAIDHCTTLPMMLQWDGHSVLVLGYTSEPRAIIAADPLVYPAGQVVSATLGGVGGVRYHEYGTVQVYLPEHLEGSQYQLVVIHNLAPNKGLLKEVDATCFGGELPVGMSWHGTCEGWRIDGSLVPSEVHQSIEACCAQSSPSQNSCPAKEAMRHDANTSHDRVADQHQLESLTALPHK
ncbi:hypothetical protein AB1Y20_014702 [Prymnesium parvum]|uniref:UFSP1/2/DUB catalytic domain-containing protein n=1 Tax=Prymnesium parvum TaxID=97485 RepID=A0AB34IBM5_PRYPA